MTDQIAFGLSAASVFVRQAGIPDCGGTTAVASTTSVPTIFTTSEPLVTDLGPERTVTVIPGAGASNNANSMTTTTGLASQLATLSSSNRPSLSPSAFTSPALPSLDLAARIGIGISVPFGIAAFAILGFFLWRWDRRQRQKSVAQQKALGEQANPSTTYVQQKAELDAEQTRYEMEINEVRHEIGVGESHELSGEDRRARQELRGEDHSRELEVPLETTALSIR